MIVEGSEMAAGTVKKLNRPMAPADFARGLELAGFTTTDDAAEHFRCSPRVIQYWKNEEAGRQVPPAVAALVRLLVDGRIRPEELGK